MKISLVSHLQSYKKQSRKGFAILIDPDKVSDNHLAYLTNFAESSNAAFILVGGSLVGSDRIHHVIATIKTLTTLPVVIFPGSTHQISPQADALLFLSLISGRNPELLIGKHVEVAPLLRNTSLEVIPTGYMLIDSGKLTTAHYMSNTLPIPHDKPDIAAYTALAGQYLGLKWIYLDGGSGAHQTVTEDMVHAVSKEISVPLIVGGGIRSIETAQCLWKAGADIIVIGNALEESKDSSLFHQLSQNHNHTKIDVS